MRLVTPEQMRAMDRRTIEEIGLPGMVLMELAALGAVDVLLAHWAGRPPRRVGILCGGGNNGGDGYAMARILAHRGVDVIVGALSDPASLRGDADTNYRAADMLGLPIVDLHDATDLRGGLDALGHCDVWCDALLGTGLDRPVEGRYAEAIRFLQRQADVFAVDIPSGLDAVTGKILGVCAQASACATFGLPKLGQALYPGRALCGELHVVDIHQPESVLFGVGHEASWLNASWGAGRLLRRSSQMHKGMAGRVLVVAGRDEYAGAALLATRAAMVAGAGLVTLATHADVTPRVVRVIQEAMASASLSEPWDDAHRASLESLLDVADAVAVGPGMGRNDTVREVVELVLARGVSPVVVDADALNVMATSDGIQTLAQAATRRPIVITPHPGEMATLCGVSTAEVMGAPLETARGFAREHGVIVVLKTATTIVATPDGRLAINATGNPGMASGGMGDALTGMLASLLHELDDTFEATCVAVHAHGAAGDAARDTHGERGVLASRLIDHLGDVFQRMTA